MENQPIIDRVSPILRQYWLPIFFGLAGLIFLVYGLISLSGSSNNQPELKIETGENSQNPVKKIYVDVEGAVVRPGVYVLDIDARVKDALIAASGLSENADRDWVAKNLNLAAKINDGIKIYVVSIGEDQSLGGVKIAGGVVAGASMGGLININSASEQDLDTLSGIGPVTAQKIIDNRPYSSVDELLSKKIIGSKVFEQVKDKITVN